MKILFRNDYDNYREALGKLAFLLYFEDLKIVRNFDDSKLMLLSNRDGEMFYASIFGEPKINFPNDYPLHIYYQKPSYNRYKDSIERKYTKRGKKVSVKKLPDGFDEKYQYFFKKGFVNPNGIFNDFYYSIAEALLTKYFLILTIYICILKIHIILNTTKIL